MAGQPGTARGGSPDGARTAPSPGRTGRRKRHKPLPTFAHVKREIRRLAYEDAELTDGHRKKLTELASELHTIEGKLRVLRRELLDRSAITTEPARLVAWFEEIGINALADELPRPLPPAA